MLSALPALSDTIKVLIVPSRLQFLFSECPSGCYFIACRVANKVDMCSITNIITDYKTRVNKKTKALDKGYTPYLSLSRFCSVNLKSSYYYSTRL